VNNFLTRTITGALFVIVVIGSSIWDLWAFAAVFGIFTVFGILEFYKLVSKTGARPQKILGTIIGFAVYAIIVLIIEGIFKELTQLFCFVVFALLFLIFIIELFKGTITPLHNIACTFLGILYVSIPFSLLVSLSVFDTEKVFFTFPILYFFIIWTYDTFAYLVGIKFGKHRLYESISPKKSWEGAIGGLIFTIALVAILSEYYTFLSLMQWVGLALIIVVFGTFGDLAESMLKRSVNSKDSGNFFPGHGGILDRFDSMLLSVPFVFVYLLILEIA
jgi:phosphatidate cytidylyltransferase